MRAEIRKKLEELYENNKEEIKSALANNRLPNEVHEVVVEAVNADIKTFDFTDFLIQTKRVEANEKVYLSVPQKVDIFSASSTSDVMKQVYREKKYEVPRISLVGRYGYSETELRSGFLPAVEDMVDELSNQLQVEIQKTVVNVIRAATAGAYTRNVTGATFADAVNETIDTVLDNSLSGDCYIVGRRQMLRNVADLGASESTKEEKDKYGIIARYHDADLKPVPKVGRGQEALMGENELFIASPDCGRVVYYGDVLRDDIKTDVFENVLGVLQEIGVAIVADLGRIYRIVLS